MRKFDNFPFEIIVYIPSGIKKVSNGRVTNPKNLTILVMPVFKKLIIENLSTEQDSGDQVSIDLLEINELDIKKIDLLKRLIEGKSISNAENILSVIDSFSVDKIILKKYY